MLAAGGPDAQLGDDGGLTWGLTRTEAAIKLQLIRQRLRPSHYTTMINGNKDEVQPSAFHTGKNALLAARCSTFLRQNLDPSDEAMGYLRSCEATANPIKPYAAWTEYTCSDSALELDDLRTTTLGTAYIDRLVHPAASPPPPSPDPPPPPRPPSPPPPPQPPVTISVGEAKRLANDMEREFCESVYLLSAEARCAALATSMFTLTQYAVQTPSPPPLLPEDVRPPPPPPPSMKRILKPITRTHAHAHMHS